MKKWVNLAVAFTLGVIVASGAGTVSAKVQSLVGKKVSSEMVVVVDGKTLMNKGAVIDGVTNIPARELSESIGGKVSVNGNTVNITTNLESSLNVEVKSELLAKKEKLQSTLNEYDDELKRLLEMQEQEATPGTEMAIKSYEKGIAEKQQELDKVNEALKQIE